MRRLRERTGRAAACALLVAALGSLPSAARAAAPGGPRLTVPRSDLRAALKCHGAIEDATTTPLMLVTGTGTTGDQLYALGKASLDAYGHPVCYVNLPDFTTADIQVSVEYLVSGLRREFDLAGRKVAVFGISQGGLLARFALTYWPDLRRKVGDVVSVAGTQHGTTVGAGLCSSATPCTPAAWQQLRGSDLLRAIDGQPDETPGAVSYTTLRTLTDESVQPQTGARPASALQGASNIVIQDVCPGRTTTHIGAAADSVTFAAFTDAVRHRGRGKQGAAKVARLPSDVCDHPYATGLDEPTIDAFLAASGDVVGAQVAAAPVVASEPKVRGVFKRRR